MAPTMCLPAKSNNIDTANKRIGNSMEHPTTDLSIPLALESLVLW